VPPAPSRQRRGPQGPTAPYRRFTSSGGLEIRVGRGSRHNDDLTFRHSSPNDVWLHARHTAGAHVILRWSGAGAPPARDLEEAACLAALHSKARTSGTVPVDWTLRKYVRKPRGSAPGAVAPDRVQTLFVSPDPDLAERLGSGDGEGAERPPR
ncbi:MAG: NFACT RNA binding domain-containing protein, partial [Longimicrobiales bacterium]